uniref:HTH CENPB-type domain-containing protein n=1 Tax=Globisporangium ultimum (strain ATCC 200006 / CBS 805.95 / DAOM BR144) TaxID=431595 RepID=K3WWR4_GLOUD
MSASRTHLTIAEKNELRRFHAAQSDAAPAELLEWVRLKFGKSIGRSTLGNILREPVETDGDPDKAKKRPPLHPEVDVALLAYVDTNKGTAAITDDMLLAQAKLTANVSPSWIQRFKKRHGLVLRKPQGSDATVAEAATTDSAASAVDAPQSPRGEESGNESVLSASASKRQSIDIQKKQEVITWIANEGGGVASRAAAHFQALGWTLDPGMFRRWWRQKDEIMAQDATKKRVKGGGRKRLSLDVVPET